MDVILLSNSHKFPNCNDLSQRYVLSSFLFIMIAEKGVQLNTKSVIWLWWQYWFIKWKYTYHIRQWRNT